MKGRRVRLEINVLAETNTRPDDASNTPNGGELHRRLTALEQAQEQIDRLLLKTVRILEGHDQRMAEYDKRLEAIERQQAADRERSRELGERIDKLV